MPQHQPILCDTCAYCAWRASTARYGWWDETCVHPARDNTWPLVGAATACPGYERLPALTKFEQAVAWVFAHEGLYSNHAADRGGPTLLGVTQASFDNWRRAKGLLLSSVATLTRKEATAIYQEWYWDAGGCEWLPPVLGLCAFDAMVNHRPRVAIGLMQSTLGVPTDGILGPVTQKAYRAAVDSPQLVWKFVAARLDLYADIIFQDPTQRAFLKGWLRRAHALDKLLMS